jgi:hypothetical protein
MGVIQGSLASVIWPSHPHKSSRRTSETPLPRHGLGLPRALQRTGVPHAESSASPKGQPLSWGSSEAHSGRRQAPRNQDLQMGMHPARKPTSIVSWPPCQSRCRKSSS